MSETLTIVFRGLMIFHEDKTNNLMEIGILREPGHVPRIITIKNGVHADVYDLRERPELDDESSRSWRIEVTNPAQKGISTYTDGQMFDRKTHPNDRDFRWIMDFEGSDFYDKDLTAQVDARKLMPVLQVPVGQFYTRLKSPSLNRSEDGGELREFGAIAGVTGCDIVLEGGTAELSAVGGGSIFQFKSEGESLENTIFEITNTPPDVPAVFGTGSGHGGHGGHTGASPHQDHFQFYYGLFLPGRIPSPIFGFRPLDGSPAPNPALCGKGRLGRRTEGL